jgi:hypothetical protein
MRWSSSHLCEFGSRAINAHKVQAPLGVKVTIGAPAGWPDPLHEPPRPIRLGFLVNDVGDPGDFLRS